MKQLSLFAGLTASVFVAVLARAEASPSGTLPSEYQRVSYVGATGAQWVQTDYVPTGNAEYDFVVSFDSLQETYGVFCARSNDSTAGRAVFLYEKGLRWDYGVTDFYCADRDNDVAADTACLVSIRKNDVYVNGVKSKISKPQPASFDKNNALVLFALYKETDLGVKPTAADIIYKGKLKLYSFTVREAGVVKLDLVPCYRKSDKCVGFYDRVSEMFLTTPSGALANGPNVDSDFGAEEVSVMVRADYSTSDPDKNHLSNGTGFMKAAGGTTLTLTADAWKDALAAAFRSPIGWTLVSASAGEPPMTFRSDGAHNCICSFSSPAGSQHLLKWHYVATPLPHSFYWPADGYERLKFVQTDGTQHLVTDYTPNGNTSIEVKMSPVTRKGTQGIYCARGPDSSLSSFTLFLLDGNFRWDYGAEKGVDTKQLFPVPSQSPFLFSNERNKVYVDGAETILSKQAYSEYTAVNRLVLFASYGKPADEEPADFANGASLRLYAFRVSEDGVLKMDLVPCRRTSDGAIGLYDTVKGEFCVPAGNALQYESYGESAVTEIDLPPEYAKIGGVEATGSQYVLTDYRPNGNSCLKMKMTLKSKETQALFCSRGATATLYPPYSLFLFNGNLRWDYANVDTTKGAACETGKPMTVTSNKHLLYVDGTKSGISKSEAVDYEAGNRLVLFAAYTTDWPGEPTGFSTFAKVILHEFEITEGGKLKLRLVPCYRVSDKVVGLYDTVAMKFYEPGGGALRGASGIGLEVVGTGLGALGEPTLPYGVTENVVAGDSFVCAAPDRVKTADGWAVCRGYLLETNGVDALWYKWKGGKETSFVYEHPAKSAVRLSWKWKKERGLLLYVR